MLISPVPVASTWRRLTVTFQPRVPLVRPCRWRCIQVPLEKSGGGPAGGLSPPCCQRDIWRDLTCILLFSLLSGHANSGSGADDSLWRDCGRSQSAAQREVEGSLRRQRGGGLAEKAESPTSSLRSLKAARGVESHMLDGKESQSRGVHQFS